MRAQRPDRFSPIRCSIPAPRGSAAHMTGMTISTGHPQPAAPFTTATEPDHQWGLLLVDDTGHSATQYHRVPELRDASAAAVTELAGTRLEACFTVTRFPGRRHRAQAPAAA